MCWTYSKINDTRATCVDLCRATHQRLQNQCLHFGLSQPHIGNTLPWCTMPRGHGSANPTSLCSGGTFPIHPVHRHLLRCQPLPVSFTNEMSAYNSGPQTNFRECCMVSRQSVSNIDDRTIPWPSTLSAFPRLKPPSAGFVPSTNAKCQTKFEGTVTYSHFFVSLGSLTISFLGTKPTHHAAGLAPSSDVTWVLSENYRILWFIIVSN